jgi:hypothetical protein
VSTQAIFIYNHNHPTWVLDTFSISEYFSEYKFMVIHNIEKASTYGGAQNKESTPVEREIGSPLEEVWVHL